MEYLVAAAAAFWLGILGGADVQTPYSDQALSEGWAWSRIQLGQTADFNLRCQKGVTLDPRDGAIDHWQDPCRRLDVAFIRQLLTVPSLKNAIPARGINLIGARLVGDVDLSNIRSSIDLSIGLSRIEGNLALQQARFDSVLSIEGTVLTGTLNGEGLRAAEFLVGGSDFKGPVSLLNAKIEGTFYTNPYTGQLWRYPLPRTTFERNIDARFLSATTIAIEFTDFDDNLDFQRANITNDIYLRTSNFDPNPQISSPFASFVDSHIGGTFVSGGTTFRCPLLLSRATVDGDVDLSNSNLLAVEMIDTRVSRELRLWTKGSSARWEKERSRMSLRNARVGALQDSTDAWPEQLELEGFTFDRFGGDGSGNLDASQRSVEWWDGWIRRDGVFSTQPYNQVAGIFSGVGNRDEAAAIRFYGRERERDEAFEQRKWGHWIILTLLKISVGYGIGDYTFRALYWLIGLTIVGAAVLQFSPAKTAPRGRWFLWSIGASLRV
jgi:hypothetical protein